MNEIKTTSLYDKLNKAEFNDRNYLKRNMASLYFRITEKGKQQCAFNMNASDGKEIIDADFKFVDIDVAEYAGDTFLHFSNNHGWELFTPKGTTGVQSCAKSLTISFLQQLGYSTHENIRVKLYLEPTRVPYIYKVLKHEKV